MGEYFTTQGAEGDCAQGLAEAQGFLSGGCYAAVIADLSMTGSRGAEGLELGLSASRPSRGGPTEKGLL